MIFMEEFSIGQLAQKADCKVPTIRYYEQIGLLPAPKRNQGNQRRYNEQHLIKLRFVRHARALGFDLDAIRELSLLSEHPDKHCHEADLIAQRHLVDIGHKIQRLQSLQFELSKMLNDCSHGDGNHCRVLEVLADHSLCEADHVKEADNG